FVAMQNCFCVIYRVRPRSLLQQNILALSLTVVFVVGGQLLFLASEIPTTIVTLFLPRALDIFGPLLTKAIGVFVGFLIALVFFLMIYTLLPNRRVRFGEVWRGAGLAAALLVAYLTIFPLYTLLLLRPNAYGAAAGFVILLLFFVYYLSLILLFGAELNAWTSGLRSSAGGFARYLDQQGNATTPPLATHTDIPRLPLA
ncbi:MAG TPA: YhjD/YihY/BrkB family envelope integrity protein, partial [Ktedonobacterales bacterium]|nr:YhjD/YihY/BrkB family envelope integrity protein [Ktedonobacterales bacterium]